MIHEVITFIYILYNKHRFCIKILMSIAHIKLYVSTCMQMDKVNFFLQYYIFGTEYDNMHY